MDGMIERIKAMREEQLAVKAEPNTLPPLSATKRQTDETASGAKQPRGIMQKSDSIKELRDRQGARDLQKSPVRTRLTYISAAIR